MIISVYTPVINFSNNVNIKLFFKPIGNDIIFSNNPSTILGLTVQTPVTCFSSKIKDSIDREELLPTLHTPYNFQIIEQEYQKHLNFLDNVTSLFPDPDINQIDKEKSFEWKSVSIGKYADEYSGKIKAFQYGLKFLRKKLEIARRYLTVLRQIIRVINSFLTFYEDMSRMIINRFADEIDRFVQNIKSTGVYFLDMTTYHFHEDLNEDDSLKYYRGPWWFREEKEKDNVTVFTGVFKRNDNGRVTLKGLTELEDDLSAGNLINELFSYKKENYYEFIDKICHHFLDPNDVLPRKRTEDAQSIKKDQGDNQEGWSALGFNNSTGEWGLKTGRPDFGSRSTVSALILTIALPDIVQLYRILYPLCKEGGLFNDLLDDVANYLKPLSLILGEDKEEEETDQSFISNIIDKITDTSKNKIEESKDYIASKYPTENFLLDQEGSHTYPHWRGINLGNLLGKWTDHVDKFTQMLRNFADDIEVDRSILDSIDDQLKRLIKTINTLIQIINTIDNLLEYINIMLSLTTMASLYITVTPPKKHGELGGTERIVQEIRKARGFFKSGAFLHLEQFQEVEKHIRTRVNELYNKDEVRYNKISHSSIKTLEDKFKIYENRYNLLNNLFNNNLTKNIKNKIQYLIDLLNVIDNHNSQIENYNIQKENIINDESLDETQKDDLIEEIDNYINLLNNLIDENNDNFISEKDYLINYYYSIIDSIYNADIWPIKIDEDGDEIKIYNLEDTSIEEYENMINYNQDIKYYANEIINIIDVNESESDVEELNIEELEKILEKNRQMLKEYENKAKDIYNPDNNKGEINKFQNYIDDSVGKAKKITEEIYGGTNLGFKNPFTATNEIRDMIHQASLYDLNTQMCYAGVVFCWGYPHHEENFTGWNEIKTNLNYQDETNRGAIDKLPKNQEGQFKHISKIMGKIFK